MEALKILGFWTVGLPVWVVGVLAGALYTPFREGWLEGKRLTGGLAPPEKPEN